MSDDLDFDAWLLELDREAEARGYGPALSRETGRDCWLDYFECRYSPAGALDEDEDNA